MWLEKVQNKPKNYQNRPINLENQANDPKISKKGASYCKIPTQDKKRGTCPQYPTAGPQTY